MHFFFYGWQIPVGRQVCKHVALVDADSQHPFFAYLRVDGVDDNDPEVSIQAGGIQAANGVANLLIVASDFGVSR